MTSYTGTSDHGTRATIRNRRGNPRTLAALYTPATRHPRNQGLQQAKAATTTLKSAIRAHIRNIFSSHPPPTTPAHTHDALTHIPTATTLA